MPGRDGTGPLGRGPAGGGRRGGGPGSGGMGGSYSAGPGGFCLCPQCGTKTPHVTGIPCSATNCPQCGARMVRD